MTPEIRKHYAALIAAYKALNEAGQYIHVACLPDTAEVEAVIRDEIKAAGLALHRDLGGCWLFNAISNRGDLSLHLNRDERRQFNLEEEVAP